MKKIGMIYWHSVVRNWRNGGRRIGRQGPQQTVVIVEDEEEEKKEEREKRSYNTH